MRRNKPKGCVVLVPENMPVSVALRKFKQKVIESGVLETAKDNMYFEKPTTARKRKAGAARARWQRQVRNNELPKKLY